MASPVEVEILDATIFVDRLASQVDLLDVVAETLGGTAELNSARASRTQVQLVTNDDADPYRAGEWPGGFLFFPAVLEVYTPAKAPRRARADVTARLLTSQWPCGVAAVAACEYEDLLPAAAGTADRSLPWPDALDWPAASSG